MGDQLIIQFSSIEQKEKFMNWFIVNGFNLLISDYPYDFESITEFLIGEMLKDNEQTGENGFMEIE